MRWCRKVKVAVQDRYGKHPASPLVFGDQRIEHSQAVLLVESNACNRLERLLALDIAYSFSVRRHMLRQDQVAQLRVVLSHRAIRVLQSWLKVSWAKMAVGVFCWAEMTGQ